MDNGMLEAKKSAPVYAEATVRISAPRDRVWALMADVSGWPSWNPGIASAQIDGELSRGARIVWKSGPGTIRSTVADVQPGERLSWTGSLMGIQAIHVWTLDTEGDETTVTTQESWEGLVVRLTKESSQRALDDALATGLRYLKAVAEKSAGDRGE
jgi:uncharacterized protein YndB with AHSA1/START domain